MFGSFILGLFLLGSVFAQESTPTPEVKLANRVMWDATKECILSISLKKIEKKPLIECDSFVQEGSTVKAIRYEGISLAVILADDGDYLVADTYVFNNSDDRVLVDPNLSQMLLWKDGDTKKVPETLTPIAGTEIAKKITNRIAWANALGALGASMQTQTSTVQSTSNGTATVTGNGQSATGVYSGTSQATITTPNTQAQVAEAARARSRSEQGMATGSHYITNGLRANTLFGKSSINGMIFFKRKNALTGVFTIKLNDVYFDFVFSNRKK